MLEIFSIPVLPYLKIEIHYQGRKINKKFYKEHKGLFANHPSYKDVVLTRNEILKSKEMGITYSIILFEDGISVIET